MRRGVCLVEHVLEWPRPADITEVAKSDECRQNQKEMEIME